MRTRIELGSSGSVDLFEDIPISLNYSIADIRSPEKRNASFSKTISIPGSKNNNKLFGHIFEIGIDGSFNPNTRTPAIIYIDDCEQMKGFLRLIKIKRNDDTRIVYECSVTGNVGNIFAVLRDDLLNRLNLSEYNHTYSKSVQKASWSASVGSGYVYPMIDYGVTNGLTYDVKNFYPAIYLKTYIDKIFAYAGYTYSSSFFTSDFFKRLIIPYNGEKLNLTQAQIDARLFSASIGSSGSITIPSTSTTYTNEFNTPIAFNSETLDPSNQYNPSTYRFKAATRGYYNFSATITAIRNTTGTDAIAGWYHLLKYSAGVPTRIANAQALINPATAQAGGVSSTDTVSAANVLLDVGDEVYVGAQLYRNNPGGGQINITAGTFSNSVSQQSLEEGTLLPLSSAIPDKITMKELFISVIKMFNLYIETDKDTENKLIIEPRNDFYNTSRTLDWTSKLDISQDLEIAPVGDLTSRRYIYTYTEDKDYYNDLYKRSYNEAYGTATIDAINEFVVGNNETKVVFSPTPLVDNTAHDRILPFISQTFSGATANQKAFNIRLLYYAGTLTTTKPWTYTGNLSGVSTETTYPYAGHLDSPTAPTLDLSFGVPKKVYYFTTSYVNNNVYNKYHRQFLEEITDKDSKIITGMFRLTVKDILTLDFRNQYFVDGHFLRLNKVVDYNPVVSSLTKCEFIKIKFANTFVATTIANSGGTGIDIGFENGIE